MRRPLLTELAETDLGERASFLESRRRGYARRFLAAFERTVRRIGRAPGSIARYGSDRPELAELRVCAVDDFPNLLVLFHLVGEEVEILRIIHAAQDIDALFPE